MLHQPTKYHTNPLTHFLSLHATTMTTTSSSSSSSSTSSAQIRTMLLNQQQEQHQQQQQLQQELSQEDKHHQQLSEDLDDNVNNNNNSNTPSDINEQNVGKSFTIAAILGLKKKSSLNGADVGGIVDGDGDIMGGHELHDVMNLSLNQNQMGYNKYLNNYDSDSSNNNSNNNSNINNNNSNNINNNSSNTSNNSNNRLITNRLSSLQHFHPTSLNYHTHHHQHHHQQQQQQQQPQQLNNSNSSSLNASSALQSLQQLHQQHSHAINTVAGGFHLREKSKNEHNLNKKASLKNKRVRTIFTPEQLERLEAEFERQQYMVGPERLYLAHTLQLTEAQVKVWFQNRRIKWRKHHLEITQQRLALIRQRQINSGNVNGIVQQQQQQMQNQPNQMGSGTVMIPIPDVSPELTICSDSMDVRSVSEADDQ